MDSTYMQDGKYIQGGKYIQNGKNKNGALDAAHKTEWILAGILIFMAYFYLSVIRYPTELARVIWWKAQLNTEYFRVGLAWMMFTVMFLGTGLWYVTALKSGSCDPAPSGKGRTALRKRLPKDSWFYFGLTVAAGIWFPFSMNDYQDMFFLFLLFRTPPDKPR